jgi:hypothetical protein
LYTDSKKEDSLFPEGRTTDNFSAMLFLFFGAVMAVSFF